MRLSEEYVLAKTRAESLREVRNLNLWGNGITDVSVRGAPHAFHPHHCAAAQRRMRRALTLRPCGVAPASWWRACPTWRCCPSRSTGARRAPASCACARAEACIVLTVFACACVLPACRRWRTLWAAPRCRSCTCARTRRAPWPCGDARRRLRCGRESVACGAAPGHSSHTRRRSNAPARACTVGAHARTHATAAHSAPAAARRPWRLTGAHTHSLTHTLPLVVAARR
jgi:hypothetical protein